MTENALTGNPKTEWDITGSGDASIQGFATDMSVNKGSTVRFKINVAGAASYTIRIYRLGYYQGNGARLITNLGSFTGTVQPSPSSNTTTGLVDCGNWSESASWAVPSTAVSGVYIARLTRSSGSSHIVFVVRDDAGTAPMLFKTSDATWQAYNVYGGNSLYVGTTSLPAGHASKVSYNRPFVTRAGGGGGGAMEDWLFNAEFPMIRFLERNGYNVSYTTDVDLERDANAINTSTRKIFLSVGHDEYWSAAERTKVENARNAGVHMAFFSGNEVYWKTRWEDNNRTLVCYKEGTVGENVCGTKCDPTAAWTGLWREGCSYPSGGGCKPENALTGQISWSDITSAITVPAAYKNRRFWRGTSVASLADNQTATFPSGTLGYEWDYDQYPNSYPNGRIILSNTVVSGLTHKLSLYRHSSGALVFGAGTVQWSWGLDNIHDRGSAAASLAMQQATVNLFADMGVQPGSLMSGVTAASASTDFTAPVPVISSPVNGSTVTANTTVTISGTSTDVGGVVAGIEVSVDGGNTWAVATGTTSWTFSWSPSVAGTANIRVRGFDDSGNMSVPGAVGTSANINVTVSGGGGTGTYSVFTPAAVPQIALENDGSAINVGMKFRSNQAGFITGVRYYKGAGATGTHTGNLWSSTGTKLGEIVFNSETASGWQQALFTTPVAIAANTTYIVSYHSSSGHYSSSNPYFTAAVVNGPLRGLANGEDGANGLYLYGASPAFPNSSYESSNYFVDVVFTNVTDNTPPTVTSVSPLSGATGVNLNATVTATFSEDMNASTISGTTVELRDASSTLIAATVTYNATTRVMTITPSAPLSNSTVYTATVRGTSTGVKDVAGNALAANFTWSFTTVADLTPPTVTAVSPVTGATAVNVNSALTAIFSEAMNASTITTATVELRNPANNLITATVSYNAATRTATLTPSAPLTVSTLYTATIRNGASGVKDVAGNALAATYTWTFTTEAQADLVPPTVSTVTPANAATGIAVNTALTAVFSEAMTAATISTTTVELRNSASVLVTATVSYNATTRTVTLTPSAALANSTLYTATIKSGTAGVKDAAGNALVSDFVWSFTTVADLVAPTVTAVTPANSATSVLLNTTLTGVFSETMNASTISGSTVELRNASNALVASTVTYNAGTRTFTLTPTASLANSAVYTGIIKGGVSGVKDAAGNALASDYVWTFTTISNSISIFPATIVPTVPRDNDGSAIVLGMKFRSSENGTVTGVRFYKGAGTTGTHTGTLWSLTGTKLGEIVFINETASGWQQALFTTPVAITANTVYVVSYHSSSGDYAHTNPYFTAATVNGPLRALANGESGTNGVYRYSATVAFPSSNFQTSNYWVDVLFSPGAAPDVTPPTVTSVTPLNNATAVSPAATVNGIFSETMNAATISGTTVELRDPANALINATVSYNATTRTVTLTPAAALLNSTLYRATIKGGTAGVKDAAGNALAADFTWTFTTAADATPPTVTSVTPLNNATAVSLTTSLTGIFNEAMNASTVSGTTVELRAPGNILVAATVSYNATTRTFTLTPSAALANATLYTGIIKGGGSGVKDAAGNALAADFTWTFTTEADITAPLITGVTPLNNATGVSLTTVLTATFNEAMGESSVNSSTIELRDGNNVLVPISVSYNATTRTATVTPTAALSNSVNYSALIKSGASGVKDAAGNALAANYTWSFTTAADLVAPLVTLVSPTNNATGLSINTVATAVFNEAMSVSSINNSSVELRGAGNVLLPATVSYDAGSRTISITPSSALAYSVQHSVIIKGGVPGVKDAAGNALATDYNWSFTTMTQPDIIPPSVSSVSPVNAATGIAVNTVISAVFSEAIDVSTINTSTIALRDGSNAVVPSSISYDAPTRTLTITAASAFANSAIYTVTILGGSSGVKDPAGNALAADYSWSFTTAPEAIPPVVVSVLPANNSTGISVNTNLQIVFNEAMDPASISATTIELRDAGNILIPSTVSYNAGNLTATLTPSAGIAYLSVYTAHVKSGAAGVKDLVGNALVNEYIWSFTTMAEPDLVAPTLTSVSPLNGATGSSLATAATAVFSEALDPATVSSSTFELRDVTNNLLPAVITLNAATNTVTITPAASLLNSTLYTISVKSGAAGVKDLSGNALANDYNWSFTTEAEAVPPVVSSVSPANNASGVVVNTILTVVFNEAMDASSVSNSTIELRDAGNSLVPATVSYNPATLTATVTLLSDLAYSGIYTAQVKSGVSGVKDLVGNALLNDYTWSFTTMAEPDLTAPAVISVNPLNAATGISLATAATAVFSEALDPATVSSSTFELRDITNNLIPAVITLNATTNTVTITPAASLLNSTLYTISVKSGAAGVKDLSGNALANDYNWSFTTEAEAIPPVVSSVSPANNASGVVVNTILTVVFNEAMDASSVSNSTIELRDAGNSLVPATVSYNPATLTATVTLLSDLAYSGIYTAQVKSGVSGVKDLVGNALLNDYTWSFTTMAEPDLTAPTVTSVNPANAASGVSRTTTVAAVFSEAINPATISNATVELRDAGNAVVPAVISFNAATNTVTITPNTSLAYSTQYTAVIKGTASGVTDLAGNTLAADYSWSFTTEADVIAPVVTTVTPSNNSINITTAIVVAAQFSEAMDASTVNSGTVELRDGGNSLVPATISYDAGSGIVTLTPASSLANLSSYTVTIKGGASGVKDLAGNELAADYSWSFLTIPLADLFPPTVSSVSPPNGASSVSVATALTATFNEGINASTISNSTVELRDAGNALIAATISFNIVTHTVTITPAASLSNSAVYTATIKGGSSGVTDLAGNALSNDYTWSFTTEAEAIPPVVSAVSPANNSTAIAVNTTLTVTFSEAMDGASITTATIELRDAGNALIPASVSYNPATLTATLTPSANLSYLTAYTAYVKSGSSGVKDLAGNSLVTEYTWSFATMAEPDLTAPTVSSVNPSNGTTGVALNTSVTAIFSEAVDPSTISAATIELRDAGNALVASAVSYNAATNTATLTPSAALSNSVVYTARVKAGSSGVKDLAGNALAVDYTWSFTAVPEAIPPVITTVSPANNATSVAINTQLTVIFNEAMDVASLNTTTIELRDAGNALVPATVSYNPATLTATLTPSGNISYLTVYTAHVKSGTAGVKDIAGNALVSEYIWSFTTMAEPDLTSPTVTSVSPLNGATGVSLTTTVSAIFSEAVDPATINSSTVELRNAGSILIPSVISFNAATRTVTLTPSASLSNSVVYTTVIKGGAGGVKDLAGNALAADYGWSFTAVPEAIPPVVNSVSPANNATGIPVNTTLTVVFNEAMDAASVNNTTIELRNAGNTVVPASVSYNPATQTATLTPSANISYLSVYTAHVKSGSSGVKDLAGNSLVSEYVWSFTTMAEPDITGPIVTGVSPSNGATGVSLGTLVTATFNEAVDPATVNSSTVELRDAGNALLAASISYNATTHVLTLTPASALSNSVVYTAHIKGGASGVKDLVGNALAAEYIWSFTSIADLIAPTVLSVAPVNGATGIAIAATPAAVFNEVMNAASISASSVELRNASNALVLSSISYNAGTRTVTITPNSPLANSTTFTVILRSGASGVKDAAGNSLAADYAWTFTTVADFVAPVVSIVAPGNGATGVNVNVNITAVFNEPMNASTINGTTVELRNPSNGLVPAVISYDAGTRTMTLTPSTRFANSSLYTATIKAGAAGVKDAAGNPLAADYTWSFTTEADLIPPTVTTVSPLNGTTDVHTTNAVNAIFSEDMTASTINTSTVELRNSSNVLIPATVAYFNGAATMVLTPSAALANSSVYTVTIRGGSSGVKDAVGNALVTNYTWSFTTEADATAPTVTTVTPTNNATAVAITSTVTGVFNEPMNAATISSTTVELRNSANALISAAVSYNSTTRTVTLTPSASLTSGTVFTATIKGGSSGVKDAAGNALATDYSWSFTTAVASVTIFQPNTVPVNFENDGTALVVGVKFRSTQAGFITGIRYYKGPGTTGTRTGNLWSSTGTKLAEIIFSGETASGWQQALFGAPVAINANTTYVASYHSSSGDYVSNNQFFSAAVVNAPLRALANGEDGSNGVYRYSATPAFPSSSFESSNYWVDVVYTPNTGPDVVAPTITAVTPLSGAVGVANSTAVIVTFSESINPATVTSAAFELRNSSNVLVPASISALQNQATLTPNAALSYTSVYTATIKGGASGVKDLAGNALAADYSWTFTVTDAPPPPITGNGPGGPILVVNSASNPFSRYTMEIMRAEGLNHFLAKDIADVTVSDLNNYDVVILGEIAVNTTQATMFTNWVNAGGTLVAFRPATQLSSLLGITKVAGSLADQYLLVNTSSGPGVGIVNQTIQFHGTADLYTLNGASSLATLYSSATVSTAYPAVTTREVGSNGGRAIAFTYDLNRSIVYTRQGNPAWAGQKRDGQAGPIRSDDLFYGGGSTDWINLNKVAIPQADEQQRLLTNIILQGNLHRKPLPRFWFLPRGLKAAVVMTGDDHAREGTTGRFDQYLTLGPNTATDVADWKAIRGTSYIFNGTPISNTAATNYQTQGFEIALHLNTDCENFSATSLGNDFTAQLSQLAVQLPGISAPVTNRTHCMPWSDWASHAKVQAQKGIRFDVNYYYWPGAWIQNRSGMFTGSGMPMRFADTDGTLIDCYQAVTQMTDESGIALPAFSDQLLDRALGSEGYYGVFVANMHTDTANHVGSNRIIASALARQIPVISAKQMLSWLDGRNNSYFGAMTWTNNQLSFPVTALAGARNLKGMVPYNSANGHLISVTRNGNSIAFTTETIKGIQYGFFDITLGTSNYVATYTASGGKEIVSDPVVNGDTAVAAAPKTASIRQAAEELLLSDLLEIVVMPNPSSTYFNLFVKGKPDSPVTLRILDMLGRVTERHEAVSPNTLLKLGDKWKSGTYFAEAVQGGQRKVVKIIKIN